MVENDLYDGEDGISEELEVKPKVLKRQKDGSWVCPSDDVSKIPNINPNTVSYKSPISLNMPEVRPLETYSLVLNTRLRLDILTSLLTCDKTCSSVAAIVNMKPKTVRYHLDQLTEEKLLKKYTTKRQGITKQDVMYRITDVGRYVLTNYKPMEGLR